MKSFVLSLIAATMFMVTPVMGQATQGQQLVQTLTGLEQARINTLVGEVTAAKVLANQMWVETQGAIQEGLEPDPIFIATGDILVILADVAVVQGNALKGTADQHFNTANAHWTNMNFVMAVTSYNKAFLDYAKSSVYFTSAKMDYGLATDDYTMAMMGILADDPIDDPVDDPADPMDDPADPMNP